MSKARNPPRGLGTTAEHAEAMEARGADLEALARKAVRIAAHRGYVTAGLANGTSLIAAKHLGYIRKDKRRKGDARYLLTKEGKKVAEDMKRESNPANTPWEREISRHMKKGKSQHEAVLAALKKWPNTRTVACYVPMREHRTALTRLAKDLIKEKKAIDYRYDSAEEMRHLSGDSDTEARFEITMIDRETPLPALAPYLSDAGIEGGFLDCYDDDYGGDYDEKGRQANGWTQGCGDIPQSAGRLRNPWEHIGGGCMVGESAEGMAYPCDEDFQNTDTGEQVNLSSTLQAHLELPTRYGGVVDDLSEVTSQPGVDASSLRQIKAKLLR